MKLIITEKPGVAQSICKALEINDNKKNKGYIENKDYIVSWCYGHLAELAQPAAYGEQYIKWSYESLPVIPEKWQYEIKKDTKEQFNIIKKLMADDRVDEICEATDAGREGELIFRLVYKLAGCNKPIKRLWISSLEEEAIKEGFKKLKDGSEYDRLYSSAWCRQEADWLVGINGTRLFSVLYGRTLKVGRVQTPTLAMLTERQEQIDGFQKEAYYNVHIKSGETDAISGKTDQKEEAEDICKRCDGKSASVKSITGEEKKVAAPGLFDLTSLQRDANRLFGYTAKQTLEYSQALYEKKLITYPRTDSRFLSDDMEESTERVIKELLKVIPFLSGISYEADIKRVLDSSRVSDHHAIIPTAEIANEDLNTIPEGERRILYLVADRLICATGREYRYRSQKAELICEDQIFTLTGTAVTEKGWTEYEDRLKDHYQIEKKAEKILPSLSEGQVISGIRAEIVESFTKPPKYYTEDTLLSAMERAGSEETADDAERKGLGTPATRADIIEKLVKEGYVKRQKKNLIPTEDGIKLITILPGVIRSADLTAGWENALTKIAKGERQAEDFMEGIKNLVKDLVHTYHEVSEGEVFNKEKEILGKCPKCGADVISGRYGAYCEKKCGMTVNKAIGQKLNDSQVKKLLMGEKILLKGLQSKKGSFYDAYLIPKAIRDFHYKNGDGREVSGYSYDFEMEFPKPGDRKGEKDGR